MTWILTATGNQVDMAMPRVGSINLATIAHHLSLINRFCGATCRPYSVAEHSLLVLEILERQHHLSCNGLFAGLMHDAHEAYVNDMATPAKRQIEGWTQFEGVFERLVRTAFGMHTSAKVIAAEIRSADLIALATERAQLLPPEGDPWAVLEGVTPITWVDLMSKDRLAMTWSDWRQAFHDRAETLDYQRQLRAKTLGQPAAT